MQCVYISAFSLGWLITLGTISLLSPPTQAVPVSNSTIPGRPTLSIQDLGRENASQNIRTTPDEGATNGEFILSSRNLTPAPKSLLVDKVRPTEDWSSVEGQGIAAEELPLSNGQDTATEKLPLSTEQDKSLGKLPPTNGTQGLPNANGKETDESVDLSSSRQKIFEEEDVQPSQNKMSVHGGVVSNEETTTGSQTTQRNHDTSSKDHRNQGNSSSTPQTIEAYSAKLYDTTGHKEDGSRGSNVQDKETSHTIEEKIASWLLKKQGKRRDEGEKKENKQGEDNFRGVKVNQASSSGSNIDELKADETNKNDVKDGLVGEVTPKDDPSLYDQYYYYYYEFDDDVDDDGKLVNGDDVTKSDIDSTGSNSLLDYNKINTENYQDVKDMKQKKKSDYDFDRKKTDLESRIKPTEEYTIYIKGDLGTSKTNEDENTNDNIDGGLDTEQSDNGMSEDMKTSPNNRDTKNVQTTKTNTLNNKTTRGMTREDQRSATFTKPAVISVESEKSLESSTSPSSNGELQDSTMMTTSTQANVKEENTPEGISVPKLDLDKETKTAGVMSTEDEFKTEISSSSPALTGNPVVTSSTAWASLPSQNNSKSPTTTTSQPTTTSVYSSTKSMNKEDSPETIKPLTTQSTLEPLSASAKKAIDVNEEKTTFIDINSTEEDKEEQITTLGEWTVTTQYINDIIFSKTNEKIPISMDDFVDITRPENRADKSTSSQEYTSQEALNNDSNQKGFENETKTTESDGETASTIPQTVTGRTTHLIDVSKENVKEQEKDVYNADMGESSIAREDNNNKEPSGISRNKLDNNNKEQNVTAKGIEENIDVESLSEQAMNWKSAKGQTSEVAEDDISSTRLAVTKVTTEARTERELKDNDTNNDTKGEWTTSLLDNDSLKTSTDAHSDKEPNDPDQSMESSAPSIEMSTTSSAPQNTSVKIEPIAVKTNAFQRNVSMSGTMANITYENGDTTSGSSTNQVIATKRNEKGDFEMEADFEDETDEGQEEAISEDTFDKTTGSALKPDLNKRETLEEKSVLEQVDHETGRDASKYDDQDGHSNNSTAEQPKEDLFEHEKTENRKEPINEAKENQKDTFEEEGEQISSNYNWNEVGHAEDLDKNGSLEDHGTQNVQGEKFLLEKNKTEDRLPYQLTTPFSQTSDKSSDITVTKSPKDDSTTTSKDISDLETESVPDFKLDEIPPFAPTVDDSSESEMNVSSYTSVDASSNSSVSANETPTAPTTTSKPGNNVETTEKGEDSKSNTISGDLKSPFDPVNEQNEISDDVHFPETTIFQALIESYNIKNVSRKDETIPLGLPSTDLPSSTQHSNQTKAYDENSESVTVLPRSHKTQRHRKLSELDYVNTTKEELKENETIYDTVDYGVVEDEYSLKISTKDAVTLEAMSTTTKKTSFVSFSDQGTEDPGYSNLNTKYLIEANEELDELSLNLTDKQREMNLREDKESFSDISKELGLRNVTEGARGREVDTSVSNLLHETVQKVENDDRGLEGTSNVTVEHKDRIMEEMSVKLDVSDVDSKLPHNTVVIEEKNDLARRRDAGTETLPKLSPYIGIPIKSNKTEQQEGQSASNGQDFSSTMIQQEEQQINNTEAKTDEPTDGIEESGNGSLTNNYDETTTPSLPNEDTHEMLESQAQNVEDNATVQRGDGVLEKQSLQDVEENATVERRDEVLEKQSLDLSESRNKSENASITNADTFYTTAPKLEEPKGQNMSSENQSKHASITNADTFYTTAPKPDEELKGNNMSSENQSDYASTTKAEKAYTSAILIEETNDTNLNNAFRSEYESTTNAREPNSTFLTNAATTFNNTTSGIIGVIGSIKRHVRTVEDLAYFDGPDEDDSKSTIHVRVAYTQGKVPPVSAYMSQDFSLLKPPSFLDSSSTSTKTSTATTINNNDSNNNDNNNNSNDNSNNNSNDKAGCPSACLPTHEPPGTAGKAAVSAVLTTHFGPAEETIVPFDLVLLDLAENYDNTTGMFICTVPGTYVISLYLMSHPGAKVNARIFINNRPIAALWADDSKNAGFYPSSSTQTIAQLGFGDQLSGPEVRRGFCDCIAQFHEHGANLKALQSQAAELDCHGSVYVMLVDGGYGESWVHANYNAFTLFLLREQSFSP